MERLRTLVTQAEVSVLESVTTEVCVILREVFCSHRALERSNRPIDQRTTDVRPMYDRSRPRSMELTGRASDFHRVTDRSNARTAGTKV